MRKIRIKLRHVCLTFLAMCPALVMVTIWTGDWRWANTGLVSLGVGFVTWLMWLFRDMDDSKTGDTRDAVAEYWKRRYETLRRAMADEVYKDR